MNEWEADMQGKRDAHEEEEAIFGLADAGRAAMNNPDDEEWMDFESAEAIRRGELSAERRRAFTESASLFLVFLGIMWLMEGSWIQTLQLRAVGWNFIAHLVLLFLPVVSIIASRRPSADLGVNLKDLANPEVRKVMNLAVAELALIWAAFIMVPGLVSGLRPSIIVPPAHLVRLDCVPDEIGQMAGYALTLVFMTFFYGLGSEVFYRGAIQGGLNRAFGKPWRFLRVNFGPGLPLAALFYVIGQSSIIYNPFVSEPSTFTADPLAVGVTAGEGLILGYLYERTGGVLAPAALHAAAGILFFGLEFLSM